MADTTISSLPLGTPSVNSILPYSDGAQTYSTALAQLSSLPFIPKAWVNFDGTAGTTVGSEFRCTIRNSFNINRVVRTNTGMYTIYFLVPMANSNYCITGSIGGGAGESSSYGAWAPRIGGTTTTYVQVVNAYASGAPYNSNVSNYVIYGN